MKFSQLAVGTLFRLRDITYRKVSPLQAAPEPSGNGENPRKLIPRSAVVELLDHNGTPVKTALPDTIPIAQLTQVLDGLYGSKLQASLQSIDPPLSETQLARVRQLVDKAHEQLIAGLEMNTPDRKDT